jgi:hypothetical protein
VLFHNPITKAVAVGTRYVCWRRSSYYFSDENTVELSKSLGKDAVQILVDEGLSNIFPGQCSDWRAATKNTRERFHNELIERQNEDCEVLRRQEASLHCALREAVVEDVMKLFP